MLKNLRVETAQNGQDLVVENDQVDGFVIVVSGEAVLTHTIKVDTESFLSN